jgi:hypothetical protein
MNTEVFIYLIWFSFYGQFDLANEYLFYALDLSDNCGTRENPFKGYMTFQTGILTLPRSVFLLTGIIWDMIIGYFIFNKRNKREEGELIDYHS